MIFLLIILSGIFATWYGGSVAKMIFYCTIAVPLFSFLYTFYVYRRFRVYNTIEMKIVVKGEKIPYCFILANEDFISYTSVSVRFLQGNSVIENLDTSKDYCLLPNDRIEMNTTLKCLYRGEYKVGIDKVVVHDFMGLWEVSYPAPSTINMRVYPRIVRIEKLGFIPDEDDIKTSSFSLLKNKDMPDSEVRKYQTGDNKKMINWKASARKSELLIRKYTDLPKSQFALIMDISSFSGEPSQRIKIEDCIIETSIAISDYFLRKGKDLSVFINDKQRSEFRILTKQSFDAFYDYCVDVNFNAKHSVCETFLSCMNRTSIGFYMIVTHSISSEILKACYSIIMQGNEVVIICFDNTSDIALIDSRIKVLRISPEDEICYALSC